MASLIGKISRKIKNRLNRERNRVRADAANRAEKIIFRYFRPQVVNIVAQMAETGQGTEECLAKNCLPMKVHFYSPVPDIEDLNQRDVWSKKSDLAGIDFCPERQLSWLAQLSQAFAGECQWPTAPTSDPNQFFLHPDIPFAYSDAAILHSLIRRNKPKHIIEVGSGSSSRIIATALRMNYNEQPGYSCAYTVIDPYPSDVVQSRGLFGITDMVKEKVELTDLSLYDQLDENDILFIDGSHSVKIGGDVNFAILEVLPRLKPGVFVHFHDIPMPYEYPKVYFTGRPEFRVFWTESYLLQAFLIQNAEYEVVMAIDYIHRNYGEVFRQSFPNYDPSIHYYTGSGFWIRHKVPGESVEEGKIGSV